MGECLPAKGEAVSGASACRDSDQGGEWADCAGASRGNGGRQAASGTRIHEQGLPTVGAGLTIRPVRRSRLGCRVRLKFLSASARRPIRRQAQDAFAGGLSGCPGCSGAVAPPRGAVPAFGGYRPVAAEARTAAAERCRQCGNRRDSRDLAPGGV